VWYAALINFGRFGAIPACDERTDGQTDRWTPSYRLRLYYFDSLWNFCTIFSTAHQKPTANPRRIEVTESEQ